MKKIILVLSLLFAFTTAVFAQTEKTPQSYLDAMEAIRNSDYKAAVASFRQAIAEQPDLVRAQYYLGRTLVRQEIYNEALDAFEALIKLDPDNLLAHYEIGKLHLQAKNYADAVAKYRWLESQAMPVSRIADSGYEFLPFKPRAISVALNTKHKAVAADLAQYLLELIPPDVAEQHQLPASQVVLAAAPGGPSKKLQVASNEKSAVEPMSANLRPKILYQEKAKYTEVARINAVQGTVMLSVIFDASSQITNIRVVRGLPDGLTQSAIQAAHKIRFKPATKDGAPVSVRGTLEFSFNLY